MNYIKYCCEKCLWEFILIVYCCEKCLLKFILIVYFCEENLGDLFMGLMLIVQMKPWLKVCQGNRFNLQTAGFEADHFLWIFTTLLALSIF